MQVCPSLTSSEPLNSAQSNLQEINPLNSNISSSSVVVGVWEEVARGDDEESEADRRMRSVRIMLLHPSFSSISPYLLQDLLS